MTIEQKQAKGHKPEAAPSASVNGTYKTNSKEDIPVNNNTTLLQLLFPITSPRSSRSILIMSWTRLLSASEQVEHAVSLKTVPAPVSGTSF